jgi:solute:Na+ symporter, SSS family
METAQFTYSFNIADYIVIVGYLAMLVSVGFLMKKFCSNVQDYFIGGNRVSWWLAGASCFMMSFSAWTFTGAAGFAYKYGILIMSLFHFNAIAYIFVGFFVAKRCRQTRKVTYLQIVYDRFGRTSEQFFTWIQIPMMLFGGAIWLTGLATFVSVAFGFPMDATIIISGAIILLYSTLGGSWGVMTTDFLQSLILMALTIVIAALTVIKADGFASLIANIEPSKLNFVNPAHPRSWIFAYFLQTFILFSSINGAQRFLAVRDGKSASKAAFFAAALFIVGPLIWFIPPIAASFYFPDISAILPSLNHPQDAAYVLMGLKVLPHGLAGLLIMVIFAATLSSMDTAVNQNAAIICMNVYKPLLRPKASEREMFIFAHFANVFLGICVIVIASWFARQSELPLFDLMLLLSSSIAMPIAFPFLLVYWVKRTPPWSAVASVLAASIFSALSKTFGFLHVPHAWASNLLNSTGLFSLDPSKEWPLIFVIGGIMIISGTIFLLSALAWPSTDSIVKKRIEGLYERMNTPIDYERENIGHEDNRQFFIVGILAMIVGAGLMVMVFCPNSSVDRAAIFLTGLIIAAVGYALYACGRRFVKKAALDSL